MDPGLGWGGAGEHSFLGRREAGPKGPQKRAAFHPIKAGRIAGLGWGRWGTFLTWITPWMRRSRPKGSTKKKKQHSVLEKQDGLLGWAGKGSLLGRGAGGPKGPQKKTASRPFKAGRMQGWAGKRRSRPKGPAKKKTALRPFKAGRIAGLGWGRWGAVLP